MNDWTGFRKSCDVEAFGDALDQIEQVVTSRGGFVELKPIDSRFVKEGHDKYQDITCYCNFIIPEAGYVTEVQLLHPFARYTFMVDSERRRDPACGMVSLWSTDRWNQDFYITVKNYILDVKNGLTPERTKQELIDEVIRLHNGNVPKELMEIFNDLP